MDCINKAPAKGKNPCPDESDVRVITEDEDTLYAKAFEKCLTELAAEVYGIHEPFEIAQRTLRTACEFYEADWCGMFDADMMLDLWMPFRHRLAYIIRHRKSGSLCIFTPNFILCNREPHCKAAQFCNVRLLFWSCHKSTS